MDSVHMSDLKEQIKKEALRLYEELEYTSSAYS